MTRKLRYINDTYIFFQELWVCKFTQTVRSSIYLLLSSLLRDSDNKHYSTDLCTHTYRPKPHGKRSLRSTRRTWTIGDYDSEILNKSINKKKWTRRRTSLSNERRRLLSLGKIRWLQRHKVRNSPVGHGGLDSMILNRWSCLERSLSTWQRRVVLTQFVPHFPFDLTERQGRFTPEESHQRNKTNFYEGSRRLWELNCHWCFFQVLSCLTQKSNSWCNLKSSLMRRGNLFINCPWNDTKLTQGEF